MHGQLGGPKTVFSDQSSWGSVVESMVCFRLVSVVVTLVARFCREEGNRRANRRWSRAI